MIYHYMPFHPMISPIQCSHHPRSVVKNPRARTPHLGVSVQSRVARLQNGLFHGKCHREMVDNYIEVPPFMETPHVEASMFLFGCLMIGNGKKQHVSSMFFFLMMEHGKRNRNGVPPRNDSWSRHEFHHL